MDGHAEEAGHLLLQGEELEAGHPIKGRQQVYVTAAPRIFPRDGSKGFQPTNAVSSAEGGEPAADFVEGRRLSGLTWRGQKPLPDGIPVRGRLGPVGQSLGR